VGTLRLVRPRIRFSTNAPVKFRRDEPRSEGIFVGPAGPRFVAGTAVFTAEGIYSLTVHVAHEGGPQESNATFTLEVLPAPAPRRTRTEPPALVSATGTPPTPSAATPPAAVPRSTAAPEASAVPDPLVIGPDAAMIQRLKIGLRQVATKRACSDCPALLKRADALGAEKSAASALAEYQALVGELARIQTK
jgi:hypothetical protein